MSARPLDGLAREVRDWPIRHGNKEQATLLRLDGKRCRLDFNQSLPLADLYRYTKL
ncbi:hypothetical protein ACYX34_06325 [Nitrospira sp. CMX1]